MSTIYRWTPERVAFFRELRTSGMKFGQLVERFSALHTRQQVCDVWWAMMTRDDAETCHLVNAAQERRSAGVPMVNWLPAANQRSGMW